MGGGTVTVTPAAVAGGEESPSSFLARRRIFLRMDEYQWFLMALSVLKEPPCTMSYQLARPQVGKEGGGGGPAQKL